ncbi:hypothetical protein BAUCODRAFT_540307 [Baudoinia panamericana UAMH 10762]|uniref:GAR domain-containing protein n=1 Tax=Baudoinia panamericana (strain UAMH 10762) TaxID=717646 RepID=M2MUX8_BAUPA|nr:uncharacterized protein BAUCODRAFT_540307 [Baudoinia panamericana UAMH 10762]EMC95388.1 hypothetical protein BAUCODRAFT_540307 [Baudoinia panamericana UAMH 10762]
MALSNPTINQPILTSTKRSQYSRSPSRSPIRNLRDFDPLLRDLSPTSTLRIFAADSTNKHDSAFGARFETASASERALGAKAAQTCINLRSWTRELEGWEWPGTFEMPEPARKKMRMSGMSFASLRSPVTSRGSEDGTEELWGSMPSRTVMAYEQKVDDIGRQLESMDLDDMKGFVLAANRQAGDGWVTGNDSIGRIGAFTDLRKLDDFTALITATILQALPYLSRLHALLDVWSVRISILKQAPAFLRDMDQARTDLDHGWASIAVSPGARASTGSAHFTHETMADMKGIVEQQVSSLGQRLDAFLDELEGREETIPDAWIEDFENLETAYADWVVQAERKVFENQWRQSTEREEPATEKANEPWQMVDTMKPEPKSFFIFAEDVPPNDNHAAVIPSPKHNTGFFDFGLSPLQPETLLEPEPFMEQPPSPAELRRGDSETLPEGMSEWAQHREVLPGTFSVPDYRSLSPSKHTRHVPIVIDYERPDRVGPLNDSLENVVLNATPPLEQVGFDQLKPTTDSAVRKRAAFLNGESDRTASLQKQLKSPVRPFEHATTAWTRLFKKEKSPDQSRSNSMLSTSSQKPPVTRRSTGKGSESANEDAVVWGGRKPTSPVNQQTSNGDAAQQLRRPSHKSLTRLSSKTSSLERSSSGPSLHQRPVQRDYTDMPGGFRPRSRSAESRRRTASLTPKVPYEGQERRLERLPKPETYQPSRISSPASPPSPGVSPEPEYPADWPLASPPETQANSPVKETPPFTIARHAVVEEADEEDSGPELHSPQLAMASDTFDRFFVESFPATPDMEFQGNPLGFVPKTRNRSSSKKSSKTALVPTVSDIMLDPNVPSMPTSHARAAGSVNGSISPRGNRNMPEFADFDGGDIMEEASPASMAMSSPEAQVGSATSVDYFHAQPPSHVVSGAGSTATPKGTQSQRSASKSSTSPMRLTLEIPESQRSMDAEAIADDDSVAKPSLAHRASLASMELHPRGSVRSIEMPPRSSHGKSRAASHLPYEPLSLIDGPDTATPDTAASMTYKGMVTFPSPPGPTGSLPVSPVSPLGAQSPASFSFAPLPNPAARENGLTGSPLSGQSEDGSPKPLNAIMAKRRHQQPGFRGPTSSPLKQSRRRKLDNDTFDRHVSEVLERLPSNAITFTSKPGSKTSTPRTSEPRSYSGPRPLVSKRASSVQALTLAPAEASPKKAAADEVKLYHLTQAGREEPIKLFVRLVGEGERVMVRVGGGWADLADYLRQYAEHHGSRTVSGGGIELMTADGTTTRKVSNSTPATTAESKARSPVTPVAAWAKSMVGSGETEWLNDPQPRFTMGDSESDTTSPVTADNAQWHSSPVNSIAGQRSTPKSPSDSRPSTAGNAAARPGSRQGWAESGLAGPASGKKTELPEQKARWVEGMLEKAKRASAEKGKEDKTKHLGDIGRAGSTRRVFFRHSSARVEKNGDGENVRP